MNRRKGRQFETTITAATLLNLSLLEKTWRENLDYNAIQMIVNAKDCWVCTALPKGDMRLPSDGAGSAH